MDPSVHPSTHSFVHLAIHIHVRPLMYCTFVFPLICPCTSIYTFVHQSVLTHICLSTHPSAYVPTFPSIHSLVSIQPHTSVHLSTEVSNHPHIWHLPIPIYLVLNQSAYISISPILLPTHFLFTHPPIHPATYSFILQPTYSFHSFIHLSIYPPIYSPTNPPRVELG